MAEKSSDVSIVLRVDTTQAGKLKSAVDEVLQSNRILEKDAQRRLAESQKLTVQIEREIASTRETGRAAQSAAVFLRAENDQREQSLLTIQRANAARLAEAVSIDEAARQMKAAAVQEAAIVQEQKAAAAALHAFKIKTIGENVAAEIAAQQKLDRLHAAAFAEDIAREKARAAEIVRQRQKAGFFGQTATGALSAAGLGFGAGAVGVGIGGALAVGFASKTAMDFERAQQSIVAATGSLTAARREMAFTEAQAERLGINITDLSLTWARFSAASKNTPLEGEKTRDVFLAVAEAAQKLNLRSFETEGALNAIQQMMSKGKVQAEELRGQLGDRLPGAFNIMARALGVSNAELDKMLVNGQIMAEDALPKFAAELRKTFGTDSESRITTTISNFTRLTNEIKLMASAVGGPLNSALSAAAGAIASGMRAARTGGGPLEAARLADYRTQEGAFGGGQTFEDFKRDAINRNAFLNQISTSPTGATGFNLGSGPFGSAPGAITGSALLTRGGVNYSPDELKEINRLKEAAIDLTTKRTNVERVLASITGGELRDAKEGTKQAALAFAQAQDKAAEQKVAAKDAEKVSKDAEKTLSIQLRMEEVERNAIQTATTRRLIAEEELRTGESLTDSRKQLIALAVEGAPLAAESAEAAWKQADAAERELAARKELRAQADAVAAKLGKSSARQNRRDINSATSFQELGAAQAIAEAEAFGAYAQNKDTLDAEQVGNPDAAKDYYALDAQNYQEYQDEKTRIAQASEKARHELLSGYLDAGRTALGDAAEAAKALGKKGFEAYKAFSIAETVISTFQGAQNAFTSLSSIPYVGPALGAAAAAAAIMAGMARIGSIRSMTYDGGREFGGNVRAGKSYEINEKGAPETYRTADGRLYMLPGKDGVIRPAGKPAQAQQGGGITLVTHNFGEPMDVRVKSIMGNVVTQEMMPQYVATAAAAADQRVAAGIRNGRGPTGQMITAKYPAQPRAVR